MSKPSFSFYISLLLICMLVAPVVGQTRYGKLGIGVDGSMQYIYGAGSVNTSPAFGGGVNMSLSLMEGLSLRSKFAVNQLSWKTAVTNTSITTDFISLSGYLSIDLLPNSSFNIFPFGGAGLAFLDPRDEATGRRSSSTTNYDVQYSGGLGLEYFPNEFWSITLLPEYVLTNSRYYNGPLNSGNDSFFRVSLQIRYYFFDESFITKLLETYRDRLKHK